MNNRRTSTHHAHKKTGIAHWIRHHKSMAVSCLLLAILLLGSGTYAVLRQQQLTSIQQITAGNSTNVGTGYRNISYEGKTYQYNNQITTVLYAGIDSEGTITPSVTYTDAARADSISLVVLDKKNHKMTIISLNRDLMTQVRRFTLSGKDRGTYETHLGFAYTYGDGGTASCENLREAVETLLGIPIDEYVITNRSSMAGINDLVGGVTVTMADDDLVSVDPALSAGTTVTLDDTNVETYLRTRDTGTAFSNEARIRRQQTYITSYISQFQTLVQEDLNGTWNRMQDMEQYVQTSITKNKYLSLVNLLNAVSFTADDYYIPAGEDVEGELHDEFYVDEAALQQKVIDLFYLPV